MSSTKSMLRLRTANSRIHFRSLVLVTKGDNHCEDLKENRRKNQEGGADELAIACAMNFR